MGLDSILNFISIWLSNFFSPLKTYNFFDWIKLTGSFIALIWTIIAIFLGTREWFRNRPLITITTLEQSFSTQKARSNDYDDSPAFTVIKIKIEIVNKGLQETTISLISFDSMNTNLGKNRVTNAWERRSKVFDNIRLLSNDRREDEIEIEYNEAVPDNQDIITGILTIDLPYKKIKKEIIAKKSSHE